MKAKTGTVPSGVSAANGDGTVPAFAPRPLRNRLIGAIHAAATKAGMDADTRRALQRDEVGKESCSDMTDGELRCVLNRISPQKRGLNQAQRSGDGSVPAFAGSRRPTPQRDKVALVRKVYALLGDKPVSYAEGILKHMFKDDAPDKLEWATPDQLWRVVCALEYNARRRRKDQ